MIKLSKQELEILDLLIDKRQDFVIYKLPNSSKWQFRMQDVGDPQLFTDIKDLNGEEGYVITPFQVSNEYPIVLLKPNKHSLPTMEEVEQMRVKPDTLSQGVEVNDSELLNSYQGCFSCFMDYLENNPIDKLVLARQKRVFPKYDYSIAEAFEKACSTYPNTYVYLLHTARTGTWMGSTPEMILSGSGDKWQTVALAGTKKYSDGAVIEWDKKNILEQDIVSQYMEMQFKKLNVPVYKTGPTTIQAGRLAHLKTDFNFELSNRDQLGDILKLLHPTPAVCGLPKEEAFQFIITNEPDNRSYYSGFIGELSPKGSTDLFVNLRCVQIYQKSYTLYAGGGLLGSSTLESEWLETENKMQTMQSILLTNKREN